MKDNKHIQSFNEHGENLNISDFSESEKSQNSQKVNIYLLSFSLGIGDEYPICYELIYAENYENAINKLKEKHQKVYEIENCTIL
jgi:hypothetical protein